MARRRGGPGDPSPAKIIVTAAVLIGLVLVSLRLLPGSPFESSAAATWGGVGGGTAITDDGPATRRSRPSPSPSPSPEPLPFVPRDLDLDLDGWYGWSLLDRRSGEIVGSPDMAETSTTASMIKAWIVADYLRRTDEAGRKPTEAKLADLTKIIRDSDNTRTEQLYTEIGRSESIKRLLKTCTLTDSNVAPDKGWSRTALSPRDTARLGDCIADGKAAGKEWTSWLLKEMRLVRGAGDFGIRKAFPSAERKTIAIKNGWVDRIREQEIHVNCLAIGDTWTMGVMLRYPIGRGYEYGMDNCRKVTKALLRSAT
ncbi:Beta-lactamase enzyme family protein [Micromonospora nigra]|uniref:Beta-lactamase enzyme family protein n=1 Tax=Micromonospora nigra TaxID=145857 RepID=A0A1C6S4B5_9ACTN|nr:serine hydrolase [Micromonospora nigra]SCL24289.1 Beta-lactamase enzyme family protein [Micromonospora nigra]